MHNSDLDNDYYNCLPNLDHQGHINHIDFHIAEHNYIVDDDDDLIRLLK